MILSVPIGSIGNIGWAANTMSASVLVNCCEFTLQREVTLTCQLLQRWPLQDQDASAMVFDHARIGQRPCCQTHAGTSCSQHLRQKFMGKLKLVVSDGVRRGKQPSRQPLFYFMGMVAEG